MRKFFRGASFYILIFIIILMIVQFYTKQPEQVQELSFSELTINLENNNIKEIHLINNSVKGVLRGESGEKFTSYIPMVMNTDTFNEDYIYPAIKNGLKLTGEPPAGTPWFIDILPSVFMVLIFVVFWFVFMQQSQGGGSRVMSFGKSRAKLHKENEKEKVTFEDVAGLEEEKEELKEIVDFLKRPKKYIELGARIPKGVLMIGPPGTGKTYLSRAVAGEAGVPFFSISGSDFVEMFVGVGASRVRDLFEQAKKNAPCIIFIDEIDAVGRKRGAGLGGGHDEREQTLNQLLVEMDGFGVNEGIIMMAATNRPDILDPALLRPGRFDREIIVGRPDIKEREAILNVHARNKPLAEDVDLSVLAKRTPGFTPADLENLLNEAALLSARRDDEKIYMETIEEAITKVIAGTEKKSRVITEKEKRLTAYHEAGHAVIAKLLPDSDPVHHVTIIPRGRAGGFTLQLPQEERYYMTKNGMQDEIVVLLGGRVAEALILDDISTGASNDLQRATKIARGMITKYGMSKNLGPMTYGTGEEVFIGRDFSSKKDYSEEVAAQIDKETRDIIDNAYQITEKLLTENINKLEAVAKGLLAQETLNAEEFEVVFTEGLEALSKMDKDNAVDINDDKSADKDAQDDKDDDNIES